MGDYRLATPQRNEVYELAEKLGLDPTVFKWEEKQGIYEKHVVHRIFHTPTGAFLTIDFSHGWGANYVLDYWPRTVKSELMSPAASWPAVRDRIGLWLGAVKDEYEAPDLWSLAQQERTWLTPHGKTSDENNRPFTDGEKEQIAHHLRTIADYAVRTYQLRESHEAVVRERLDYLVKAADRVGRFDWKNLAASTLIQIVLEVGLDPQKARLFFGFAGQLLGPFLMTAARLLAQ